MSKILAIDISAYGNILINSSERLETFKETLENWQSKIHIEMKIRIRGTYANDAAKYCKKFNNIAVEIGSDFIQWRNQALFDVQTVNSKYVMIFLEDHQIISNNTTFNQIIKVLKRDKVDIFQYSWFEHYKDAFIYMKQNIQNENFEVTSLSVDDHNVKFFEVNTNYIVSLTSIFRKEILLNLLQTRRPLVRKYDSRGPFDVEKSPKLHFYLPIKFALPEKEFALCVDDEMGILGSSAIARGISHLPKTKRGVTHYSKFSPKYWVTKYRNAPLDLTSSNQNSRAALTKKTLKNMLSGLNIFTNTLEFLVFEIRDMLVFKRKKRF